MNVAEIGYLPGELALLVEKLKYKPDWKMYIEYELAEDGAGGWHFFVVAKTANSLDPTKTRTTRHGFLIPAASYNRNTWAAWLFERFRDVETHEAAEFFKLDGLREFAPHHGNGEDPYIVWHTSDFATAKKSPGDN